MSERPMDAITGAFSYTGKYVARRLLEQGRRVRTLTGHPERTDPFGGRVEAVPFNFDRPDALIESLRGVEVLYNTYWVRFTHGRSTFDVAVENTRRLMTAAGDAGVRRLVHVSIANPSEESSLPYYRGKAMLERALRETGLSHAIIRPTVIFGDEDILINNIAWCVRKFPFMAVPGDGMYRVQPIFVEDMADLMVLAGKGTENIVQDAVGPEIYSFNELIFLIAQAVGRRVRLLHVPPWLAHGCTRILGRLVHDVMLTREEIDGLMADLLASHQPPTGSTLLSEWLREHRDSIGMEYASEVARHYRK